MLPMSDLETWLNANGVTGVLANWMPTSPDQLCVVSISPGGPPTLDGHLETNLLHVRCRDTTDAQAEADATAVHTLICEQKGSVQMGATWVVSIEPQSGGPTFLLKDEGGRTTYMATYVVTSPCPGT